MLGFAPTESHNPAAQGIVVGFPVIHVQGTADAEDAFPVSGHTKLHAVTLPVTFAFPESQRLFHLFPVAPRSF